MSNATLFMVIPAVAIAIYLGLAIHVITHSPRRLINWIFGAFCLTVASYYLSSLFLFPFPQPPTSMTPFPLRWKWAAISFSSTFYLHLASHYFPQSWRWVRRLVLPPAYLVSASFSMAPLFTDLQVATPLYRPPPHIIGPVLGPLMGPFAGFFWMEVIVASVGLVAGYRVAVSPSFRRQIFYLLTPSVLFILSNIVNWITVITQDTNQLPREIGDMLMILAGILYARAVLRYGFLVGRPTSQRELFYSVLAAAVGLVALYLTLTLDQWLMGYTPFPYPLATAILLVTIAISFTTISRWATSRLDSSLFQAEHKQQVMAQHLVETLIETLDPTELQAGLLGTMCSVLDVSGGYLALSEPDCPPGTLIVSVAQGRISVQPGDQVRQPPLRGVQAHLVTVLPHQEQQDPAWRHMALLCPTTFYGNLNALLVLAEKRSGGAFTSQDLELCAQMAGRLKAIGWMIRPYARQSQYVETARLHEQALQRMEDKVIAPVHHALATRGRRDTPHTNAPLEIRLLGPLQVIRNGQPVSEAAWGTERAKAMLAFLLWRGPAGATREEISMALWTGRPLEETANVFHVTLHRLRRALEPKRVRGSRYILYKRGRYRFNPEASHWLDVTRFQALVREGKPESLREAVVLYQGPYLEDVIWALPPEADCEQRIMERLYADALRRLAVQAEGQEAMPYLEMLLAVEPFDEAAHNILVTSYLAHGRRDLAQRQVACWRKTLAELDLEPSPEAKALWLRAENTNC